MGERISVTGAELYRHWMHADAIGMEDDTQRRVRVVTMRDGTQYETTFAEVAKEQSGTPSDLPVVAAETNESGTP